MKRRQWNDGDGEGRGEWRRWFGVEEGSGVVIAIFESAAELQLSSSVSVFSCGDNLMLVNPKAQV